MLLNMPIRSLFVSATWFKFNEMISNFLNGYGVAHRTAKKDGCIAAFSRKAMEVLPQSAITRQKNLPSQSATALAWLRYSMAGHFWSLKEIEQAGFRNGSYSARMANQAMEPTQTAFASKTVGRSVEGCMME